MIESRERTIDGVTYRVAQLPATKALKLSHQLARMLGPALLKAGAAVDRKGGKLIDASINFGELSSAAESLFASCSEDVFDGIVKTVLGPEQFVIVQGAAITKVDAASFELLFAGRMKTLFKLLAFALEVNFADFFADLQPVLTALRTKAAESVSRAASTSNSPPSGESSTPA